jgi:predicted DNA-binding protein YlxM (UPF0122 family)
MKLKEELIRVGQEFDAIKYLNEAMGDVEIAKILGVSKQYVAMEIRRGMKKMYDHCKKQFGNPKNAILVIMDYLNCDATEIKKLLPKECWAEVEKYIHDNN